MNVHSWLKTAKTKISSLDAELILGFVLKKERTFLHAHPELPINVTAQNKLAVLLARRIKHEPLAYILGFKDFYGRRFRVNKNVLIPRSETEQLVELAKNFANTSEHLDQSSLKIADVGTGSGCIATTLALEIPNAHITAVDICKKALNLASKNALTLKIQQNIEFIQSDLLSAPKLKNQKFHLICANLPYVDQSWNWNSPGLAYEPQKALYAKHQGLDLIFQLLDQSALHLAKAGLIILEADVSQHSAIKSYAQNLHFQHIQTSDLILVFRIGTEYQTQH